MPTSSSAPSTVTSRSRSSSSTREPGVGPKLHRHPYAEVFVVEAGQATFRIGHRTLVIEEGHVVVSPPGEAHAFTNTGSGELRLVAVHGGARFETEWLAGPDPSWTSRPKDGRATPSG